MARTRVRLPSLPYTQTSMFRCLFVDDNDDDGDSADSLETMRAALSRLRARIGADPGYFARVYAHTFDYVRPAGARSLALDTALAFWAILVPHGLRGGALAHQRSVNGAENDEEGEGEEGWKEEYTGWWFEFLERRGGKGVSKDTWTMVRLFCCFFFRWGVRERADGWMDW